MQILFEMKMLQLPSPQEESSNDNEVEMKSRAQNERQSWDKSDRIARPLNMRFEGKRDVSSNSSCNPRITVIVYVLRR